MIWLEAQVTWVAEFKNYRHGEKRTLFAGQQSLFPDTEVYYRSFPTTQRQMKTALDLSSNFLGSYSVFMYFTFLKKLILH